MLARMVSISCPRDPPTLALQSAWSHCAWPNSSSYAKPTEPISLISDGFLLLGEQLFHFCVNKQNLGNHVSELLLFSRGLDYQLSTVDIETSVVHCKPHLGPSIFCFSFLWQAREKNMTI